MREEGCTRIRVFPFDQINPSKGNAHWQNISQKLREVRPPTLLCCEEAILGPLVVFAHLPNPEHLNIAREHCHGTMVGGFRYALGVGLSKKMKLKIAQMHSYGLSPTQIMQQHTKEVRELVLSNMLITHDTFLLSSDVRNICCKRAEELWEKHPPNPVSVYMWTNKNPNNVFYYQEHSLMDLNSQSQDDSPFTIGIQIEWQLEMMAKFGHNNALSIDATFDTSQTRVRLKSMSFMLDILVFNVIDSC